MRAEELRLESMLRPEPEAGRIRVGGQRFVLISANALGVLRKDLINALGMDRAKGFLIRYGWACGYQDALEIRDHFPWQDDLEWWRAGPALHGLEGVAHVEVTVLRRDRDRALFHMEGIWRNSYEAEQHLRYFGQQDFPVCWSLVGYASGYGSGYFGRQVIFKETQCVGQGDPHCAWVGRTLADWGDAVAGELAYYRDDKIAEELDRAYRRIQAQHQLLQRTGEIHADLTRLALAGGGLPVLATELSRLTGRGVLVEDSSLRLLACHPADRAGHGLNRIRDHPAIQAALAQLQQRQRVEIPPLPDAGLPEARLVAPIGAGGRVLGYVSILAGGRALGELEAMVAERAAAVCAIEFLRREAVLETEERIRGDLLDDLLVGRLSDAEVMARRAEYAGLKLDATYQVVVVDIDDFAGIARALKNNEQRITAVKRAVFRAVQEAARELDQGALVGSRSDAAIALVRVAQTPGRGAAAGTGSPAGTAPRTLAAALRRAVQERRPELSVSIGIGTPARGTSEFARSYREACQALDLVRRLGGHGVTAVFAELGVYELLLRSQHPDELQAFARRALGPLLAYDGRRRAGLITTLETWLHHDGHLEPAARALNLRVSGLKYRLRRIEEINGVHLADPQTRLHLQVALMIRHLAGDERGGMPHG